MRLRLAAPALCVIALAGCGGDDEEEGDRQPAATTPAVESAPPATGGTTDAGVPPKRVETVPPASPEDAEGGAGDEERIRSQAVFTGENGKVSPTRIEVPSYIAVQIILQARDDDRYVLEIKGRSLRPGDTVDLDGLRPNERVVGTANGQRVVVSATAEPGP